MSVVQDPDYDERMERAQKALEAQQERMALLSSTAAQPMYLWTKRRMDWQEIKIAVEGGGMNPYRLLFADEYPRGMQLRGVTPPWATRCYLVTVEILSLRVR